MNLKPCPFCGGEAKLGNQHSLHHVACTGCRATTIACYTPENAVDRWNTREGGRCEEERNAAVADLEELIKTAKFNSCSYCANYGAWKNEADEEVICGLLESNHAMIFCQNAKWRGVVTE